MFALANVMNFLADKFSRLSGRRFPFAGIFASSIDSFLIGHESSTGKKVKYD